MRYIKEQTMACKVENCENLGVKANGKRYFLGGMCRPHYRRFKKYGDPSGGKRLDGEALNYFIETYKNETDQCILWTFNKFHSGHGNVTYKGKCTRVHRLAMELLVGGAPEGKPEVMHLCNVPSCYNIKHLKYGTHAENMAYMSESGRSPVGEKCGTSKLKEIQIVPILEDNRPNEVIGRDYGVSGGAVWKIKNRKSWIHIFDNWQMQQVERGNQYGA